ncbi:MAG: thiamine phosphate synthase [Betaproteobacteria bacterium AqS2]|uniref:Thiamine phosphate synthase n=1 Tax=Candidatus Amphirhobacter heronislandensis TaxID=1732024 RepID=A0A930UDZ5_9GAMM|nr:thiamine phosphate synthase [Betaproteobacteria bacterium AqS2]
MGICPLVESAARIPALAAAGARYAQLRCKSKDRAFIEAEITKAAALARASGLRLIVNDHWSYCCRQPAGFVAGVHLGQEDLRGADVAAIHRKGLLLGVSAHGYAEAARALAAAPGYVSFGPVHPTMSKVLEHPPLGIEGFARLCRGLPVPAIAIGGIKPATLPELAAAGAAGAAAIQAAATAAGLRELCAAWKAAAAASPPCK